MTVRGRRPSKADAQWHKGELHRWGHEAFNRRGIGYGWYPVRRPLPSDTIEGGISRQGYVLLSHASEHALPAGEQVGRPWGLTGAEAARDGDGRPAVAIELDEAGAEQLRDLAASHLGQPVAVLVDGEVVAWLTADQPIQRRLLLSGAFTADQAQALAGRLRAGSRREPPPSEPR